MIDTSHLKAHRTACSLLKGGLYPGLSDAQKAAELETARSLRRVGPPGAAFADRGPAIRPQRCRNIAPRPAQLHLS